MATWYIATCCDTVCCRINTSSLPLLVCKGRDILHRFFSAAMYCLCLILSLPSNGSVSATYRILSVSFSPCWDQCSDLSSWAHLSVQIHHVSLHFWVGLTQLIDLLVELLNVLVVVQNWERAPTHSRRISRQPPTLPSLAFKVPLQPSLIFMGLNLCCSVSLLNCR